jgi:UDP-2,3-diacylglucosamine pyrophosphatase LpxH
MAIIGLGGIGKTQVALELAYRTREKYRNCSVFWIPASDINSLQQAYRDVAKQLRIPGWDEEKTDVKKLVQAHLSRADVRPWLLVFDNADDLGMWIRLPGSEPGSEGLKEYLPRSKQGCVLFTSRDKRTAVKLAGNSFIEVPEMDEDGAIQLLQNSLAEPARVAAHLQDAKALLAELTYLPLAIVQAAAYINENSIAPLDYLSLLNEQEANVIDLLSEDFEDDGRYQSTKNSVATTWLISFEQIRRRDSLAADYLSFMSCIDRKDIPESLLPASESHKKQIEAVGTLQAYSFIIKRSGIMMFDLHRLVHLATRNWLRKEGTLSQWAQAAIERLDDLFPEDEYRNRAHWRMLQPHTAYALGLGSIEHGNDCKINLAWKYAKSLCADGWYREAEILFREALERKQRLVGWENAETLTCMGWLASTYRDQGRWKEAEELYVREKETRVRVFGEEHPDTLATIGNLASTYRNQVRWNETEELEVQLMETFKRVLGEEHPNTLTSMSNLALTYGEQGQWKDAEELEVRVMETSLRVRGEEHPGTLTSIVSLASTYRNQGQFKEAEALLVRVMETSVRMYGEEHPDTLNTIGHLAFTYRNQGRWKEAEELDVRVMEASLRVLGEEHPSTLVSMNNLAMTYMSQGRWKETEKLSMRVMETSLSVLGEEHPDTLGSIVSLASTYAEQGRWKEAEELEVRVMETSSRVLGKEHPSTLISMNNLAMTYMSQGRWKEAEKLFVRVMETSLRVLGGEHPDTLRSMNNLTSTYGEQGRWKEAEELEVRVMETSLRVLGKEHPSTLVSMNNLASTYISQGRWKEAEKLFVRVLETSLRVLGEEHPHTLTSMNDLAYARNSCGRDVNALRRVLIAGFCILILILAVLYN